MMKSSVAPAAMNAGMRCRAIILSVVVVYSDGRACSQRITSAKSAHVREFRGTAKPGVRNVTEKRS